MSKKYEWQHNLVASLIDLSDPDNRDRASLAHLRRGLGLSDDYTLARVGWLFAPVPDYGLEAAVLVSGLFALTKGSCPQRAGQNFGHAFSYGLNADGQLQREKRFIDLLDTGLAELPHKLRQALTLIARDNVPLDWQLLIQHLISWEHEDRWVQKTWARGYWETRRPENDSENESTEADPSVTASASTTH
jgi:CRISPR type I-E-associated protein CasB/Cse2